VCRRETRVPIFDVLAPILTTHLLRAARSGDDLVFGKTNSYHFVRSTVRERALNAWGASGPRAD
jgi:hypothetical protein